PGTAEGGNGLRRGGEGGTDQSRITAGETAAPRRIATAGSRFEALSGSLPVPDVGIGLRATDGRRVSVLRRPSRRGIPSSARTAGHRPPIADIVTRSAAGRAVGVISAAGVSERTRRRDRARADFRGIFGRVLFGRLNDGTPDPGSTLDGASR